MKTSFALIEEIGEQLRGNITEEDSAIEKGRKILAKFYNIEEKIAEQLLVKWSILMWKYNYAKENK